MPRVPQRTEQTLSSLAPVLSHPAGQAIAEAAAGVGGQLVQDALLERQDRIQREQRTRNSEGRRRVSQMLNGLAQEYATRQDTAFPVEHSARAAEGLESILADYEDDADVHGAIQEFGGRAVDSSQRAMDLRAAGLQVKRVREELEGSVEAHADAAGIAATEEQYRLAISSAENEIQLAEDEGDVSAADAIELRNKLREDAAAAHARHLIREDPEEALAMLGDPEHPLLKEIDPERREVFRASAEAEIARRNKVRGETLGELRAAEERAFLARIYDEDSSNNPTLEELWSSNLTGPRAEHLAKLVREGIAGVDLDATDERLTNELWNRVHDVNHPNRITDKGDLLPFLGRGLSREDFDKLEADLRIPSGRNTNESRDKQLLTDFVARGRGQISKTTLTSIDPVGERKAYEFRAEVERLVRLNEEKGIPIFESLSPSSPNYINKDNALVDRFARTLPEQLADQQRALEDLKGRVGEKPLGETARETLESSRANAPFAEPVVIPEPQAPPDTSPRNPNTGDAPARKEGESAEDYLRRQGL